MEPFDMEIGLSVAEARMDSVRASMARQRARREPGLRRRPVRAWLGRGLIRLGERLELAPH